MPGMDKSTFPCALLLLIPEPLGCTGCPDEFVRALAVGVLSSSASRCCTIASSRTAPRTWLPASLVLARRDTVPYLPAASTLTSALLPELLARICGGTPRPAAR